MSHPHAIDTFYDDLIPNTARLRIDWRFVAALVVSLTLGTAVVLGTPRAVEAYKENKASEAQIAAAWAERFPVQIPGEWSMKPNPVSVDSMYRSSR